MTQYLDEGFDTRVAPKAMVHKELRHLYPQKTQDNQTTQLAEHQCFTRFRVGKFSDPKTTNQLHTKHLDDIAT